MNAQLKSYLREKQTATDQPSSPSLAYRAQRWRIRDRLSGEDIADIIHAFKTGTAKHVLAKRYGMNLRSLKKLLREEGVKRKSWKDIQA